MGELASPAFDLSTIVNTETEELKLKDTQSLESVVYYSNKVRPSAVSGTPQAALQLDRNAAVHSHKPVENLYLTEQLDAGVYVVAVNNYSQRQLRENIIGASENCHYRTWDDFKKQNPGYKTMENAL